MNPTGENCLDCYRPVMTRREWDDATPGQRRQWKQGGVRKHAGLGMCDACYKRFGRDARVPVAAQRCGRCGRKCYGNLCRDCTDVVSDMHELARWAS